MRRRRRFRYNRNDEFILFDEFKFYNRERNLMDEKLLDSFKTRLKQDEDEIFYTTDLYSKNGLLFRFFKLTKEETKITEYYVELKELGFTFKEKDLEGVTEIIGNRLFLKFDITEEQHNFLKELNYLERVKITEEGILNKTFNNWEELIDTLIENETVNRGDFYWSTMQQYTFSLFNIMIERPKYKIQNSSTYRYNVHTYHIFDVIEKRINNKNYRLMFYTQANENNTGDYASVFNLRVIPETDRNYNNVDKNNVIIMKEGNYYALHPTLVVRGDDNTTFIDLDVCNLIEDNITRIIGQNDAKIITPTIYKFYSSQTKRFNFKNEKVTEMESKILERYTKLLSEEKLIKIDQVYITNNSIYTENNEFNIKFKTDFFNVSENFLTLKREIDKGDARYNFNILYEIILRRSVINIISRSNTRENNYKEFVSTDFIVNNMPIEVKKEGSRINICGVFCRIDDTFDILAKAICFNNLNDYTKYVKDVSYIGLQWKKLISNGVHLYLENPLMSKLKKVGYVTNEKNILRFSLLWDTWKRNQIYIVINNVKYLIKHKPKFLQFFDYPGRSLRLVTLKEILSESLENFEEETIIEITENAIKEAKIVEERGKYLLAETIKETKAVEGIITMSNKNVEGYTITGNRTSNKYFIDKIDLNVYRWDDGKWNRRCVVSDPSKTRIYEDRLANRLMNIYNENAKITTLLN